MGRTMAFDTRYEVKTQVLSLLLAPSPPAMCGRATLAMLVSNTSMKAASETTAAISQGLCFGRQPLSTTSVPSGTSAPHLLLGIPHRMEKEEILHRSANARTQRPRTQFQVRGEHGVQNKVPENKRDEAHGGLAVARAADAAGAEVLGQQAVAALQTPVAQLASQSREPVGFGHNDAVEGEKFRVGEHVEHGLPDLGERYAGRLLRSDVVGMAGEELFGVRADHADEEIGLGGEERVEGLFGGAGAAGDFIGVGALRNLFRGTRRRWRRECACVRFRPAAGGRARGERVCDCGLVWLAMNYQYRCSTVNLI